MLGKGKCVHKKRRSTCKDCGGGEICQHQRRRAQCKDCGGSEICQHDRVRSYCKDCKGSAKCVHERVRSRCKDCNGSAICQHLKRRSRYKDCDPKGHRAYIVGNRVTQALQSNKELSLQDYLGIDIATFRAHLESQFKKGMVTGI